MAQLSKIANLALGYSFRERLEADAAGDILVVQGRDLTVGGQISWNTVIRIRDVAKRGVTLLEDGDVLFQSRGVNYRAALVAGIRDRTIAAAPLYVLKLRDNRLAGSFLVAYLNSIESQALLRGAASGSYVPQVPRGVLENLNIPLPPLEAQRALGELARLAQDRRELEERLHARTLDLVALLANEWSKAAEKKSQNKNHRAHH